MPRSHTSISNVNDNGFAVKRYHACVRQKFKFIMVSAKAKVAKFESFEVNGCLKKNLDIL